MLVLTRKISESIEIGPDVKVTIVRIGKECVRIGIDAPKHLKVKRSELPDLKPADDSDCD